MQAIRTGYDEEVLALSLVDVNQYPHGHARSTAPMVPVGQPGVAQQRPGGEQDLMADLGPVTRQGNDPLPSEGVQDCLDVAGVLACGERGPGGGDRRGGTVAAGRGELEEDVPGDVLLVFGERAVGTLGQPHRSRVDPGGLVVVGQGEDVSRVDVPRLREHAGQQR